MAVRNILAVMAGMCLVGAFGCHKSSLPGASTYPTVTSFSPQSGPWNTTVTLNGTGFDGVTNVTVGGAQATFSHINFNELTLVVPSNAATGIIALVNSEGSGGTPSSFYVTPSIYAITPSSGGPGTSVTITGYGLYGTQSVVFGNGPASANFVINNANQMQVTVPLGSTTGPITVTVPASNGTQTAVSTPFTFSLGGATAPQFSTTGTQFAPASGAAGSMVQLMGTGFTYVSAVTIGGVSCYATPAGDTLINIQVPPACVSGPITVTSGLGSSTSSTSFSVTPTITSFTPAQGPAGTLVTLTGSGFMGATGISFGGTPATGFIVLDPNTAQANVAPGSATGPITLAASGLSGQSATPFTFTADTTGLPTLLPLTTVQAYTGDTLSVTTAAPSPTGLQGVTHVYVGNIPGAPAAFTLSSDTTTITLTVPGNAQTGFISLTDAAGDTASTPNTLTILPTITGFSPASGPVGTFVTITGTGFVGATEVLFGTGQASFVVENANTIKAQVPSTETDGPITVVASGVTIASSTNYSLGN